MTGDPDDDYQVLWRMVPTEDEILVIGIPADMSPDEFEREALEQVGDLHSFRANLVRGLSRYARWMGAEKMGQVQQFTSSTVTSKLALLGVIEDESMINPRLYDDIKAEICRPPDEGAP